MLKNLAVRGPVRITRRYSHGAAKPPLLETHEQFVELLRRYEGSSLGSVTMQNKGVHRREGLGEAELGRGVY